MIIFRYTFCELCMYMLAWRRHTIIFNLSRCRMEIKNEKCRYNICYYDVRVINPTSDHYMEILKKKKKSNKYVKRLSKNRVASYENLHECIQRCQCFRAIICFRFKMAFRDHHVFIFFRINV